ncbi:hypothetical protein [Sulfitobacter sp. R86518]|uniref:hypothetical protein n=1 Tax=Sulfitobacter sp. R86518 TaxID=3093858 RepID=UPI0036DC9D6E
MFNKEKISKIALGSGLALIGEPVNDPDTEKGLILFVKAIGGDASPINKRISKFHNRLAAEDIVAKIAAPDDRTKQIEAFLSATLKGALPDLEADVTLAFEKNSAAVWISLPDGSQKQEAEAVEASARRFLSELGINDVIVKFKADQNFLSNTACLRILRRNSPCSAEELVQYLVRPGFDQMSLDDVRRFLDTARRKGLVIRRHDKKYIVTLKCLMDLGSSRDRFSPDISRALALRNLGA